MSFDMMPCSEEEAEYKEEQADRVFDTERIRLFFRRCGFVSKER